MWIEQIELEQFRNYEKERLSFHPHVNLIVGENAQGKTNLIEGIYLCAGGSSFRPFRDRDLVRSGQPFCRISVLFHKEDEERVELVITGEGKKAAKIDGLKVRRLSELLDQILVVAFTPDDLKIIKEDPARRRRFIDRELSQMKPAYLEALKSYQRSLMQRNALLKVHRGDPDDALSVWDEELVRYGSVLMREREVFLHRLSDLSGKIHAAITGGKENMRVVYRPNVRADRNAIEETLRQALRSGREADLFHGNTGKGPHKDDFESVINETNARYFGSQGQQRTAALSLKLAEIQLLEDATGETPVLLLDDVLSELDPARQHDLIRFLHHTQIFLTTTDITHELESSLPDGQIIEIRSGKASVIQKISSETGETSR